MPSSYVGLYMGASRQQHNKAPPHCLVYYSTAQHSTAKHSKAQHSTTQQNTARRSAKPVVCLHGSWARLQQARLQEAPSPWCKLLAVAVAVAVIAVVPWLRLRLRLWGSSHGAKHLPSKQPGLWEGGAGCEMASEAGRAQRQWQRPSQRAAAALGMGLGERARARARALLRTGAHCKAARGGGGGGGGGGCRCGRVVKEHADVLLCGCSAVAVPAVVVNLL